MGLLTKEDLDAVERQYIKALKGEIECAAATIGEMYRLLSNNGRLLVTVETDGESDYLGEMDDEEEATVVPFPKQ